MSKRPASADGDATRPHEATAAHADSATSRQTTVMEPSDVRLASSGLQIRCPHCCNRVEFLDEHEHSDVTCGTCGSVFSIVGADYSTRNAAALKTVGHFELIEQVGVGGFGAVWKAYDPELDRTVAVKIPRRGRLDAVGETQFLREARVAAQLRHPNIVSVHEIGREDETLYIVSDLVRGVTLSELLTGRRLATDEAIDLLLKVVRALEHAHDHGVVHRDLKPSNIMIDRQGEPHLTDFGLAKRDVGELTMTADGQILGTPAYMSPEQAAGGAHHVDRRTDVYSVGVVLFELLTGELPFRGSAQMQIHQRITEDPPNPRSLDRMIPRDLATICLKCIERDPNRRYRTAALLADDLLSFQKGRPIRARPITRVERTLRWMKRSPAQATIAALVLLLAIGGPATALYVNELRQTADDAAAQLQHALGDRDRTISDLTTTTKRVQAEATELRNRLAAWEAGVDPTAFWPPYEVPPARAAVLQRIAADEAFAKAALEQAEDDEQRALVHLALAAAAEAGSDDFVARMHYERAGRLLSALAKRNDDQPRYQLALADSLLHLSALVYADDRERAIELLRQSQALYQALAEDSDDPQLQTARLAAEQRLAAAGGYRAAGEGLVDSQRRIDRLFTQPPTPGELYELACYLSGRAAVLASPGDVE